MSLRKIAITLIVFLGIQIANQLFGLFGLPGFLGIPYAISRFITPFFYIAYYAALILFVWRVYRLLQMKEADLK